MQLLNFTLPRFRLRVALDDNPLAESPVFTDIDAKITRISRARGRNYMLDRTEAGTCKITTWDFTGDYDPDNTDSIYYGRLKSGRKCKVDYYRNGAWQPYFTGFLVNRPRSFVSILGDQCEFQLVDGFRRLSKTKITFDFDEGSSGSRIVTVLNEANWPGTLYGPDDHRDIEAGSSDVAEMSIEKRPGLEHILHVEETEMGRFFISKSGCATWIARHTWLTADEYVTPQATFGGPTGLPFQDITPDSGGDLIYNRVSGSLISGDGDPLEVFDADSEDDYGTCDLDRGQLLSVSENEATDLLQYILLKHKEPVQRFKLVKCDVLSHEPILDFLEEHDLGVRVEVVKRMPAGYTVTKETQVERFEDDIDFVNKSWELRMQMSPADPNRYWILGHATYGVLGSTTILGF